VAVAKCLGNQELSEQLMEFARGTGQLASSTVRERLSVAEFLDVSPLPEIEYLASHFYEVDVNVLKGLSHSCLSEVLESDKLHLRSEDSLLDSILALGRDYFEFLGSVRSEYLSVSGIDRLLNAVSIEEVDHALWASLCRRLRLFVAPPSIPESRFRFPEFNLDSSRPFDGIISSLTRECGGNVHTRGVVSITTSGNGRNHCHQVVDYGWNNYWYSNNTVNSWIRFDFRDRRIAATHYSILSAGYSSHHLLQWSLEGSHDGESWTVLDERNTQELNGNYIVKAYGCASHQFSHFRFLRLTQTGPNSSDNNVFMLGNLEFFGSVSDWRNQ
jgi:hypothetical protein